MQKFSLSRSLYGMWVRRYCAGGILMAIVFFMIGLSLNSQLRYSSLYYLDADDLAPFIANPSLSVMLAMFVAGAAVVASVLCFGYMKKMRSSTMIHSLPMRRETNFLSVSAAGLTLLFVPILFGGAVFAVVHILNGVSVPGAVSHWIFFSFAVALFFFGVSSFVGMLTGNSIAQFLFTFIFINIPIMLEGLIASCCNRFLFGFTYHNSVTAAWNPLEAILSYLTQAYGNYSAQQGQSSWVPLALAFFGLVFMVLALLLYRIRKIESAGDVIAMRGVRPVFRFGLALVGAVAVGSLARSSLPGFSPIVVEVVFGILGAVLGYFVAEMLIRRSLRVLRTAWKGAVCFAVVYAVLLMALNYDAMGYGSRKLQAEDVQYVAMGEYSGAVDMALSRGELDGYYSLEGLSLTDVDGYLVRAGAGDTSRMPEAMMMQILAAEPTAFSEGPGLEAAIALQNLLADNAYTLRQTTYTDRVEIYNIPVRALMKDGTVFERDYYFYLYDGQLPQVRELEREMARQNLLAQNLHTLQKTKEADRVTLYYPFQNQTFDWRHDPALLTTAQWQELYAALEQDLPNRQGEITRYYRNAETLPHLQMIEIQPEMTRSEQELAPVYICYGDENAIAWLLKQELLTQQDLDQVAELYK